MEPWTILKVLDWTRGHFEQKGLESPRLDAELILAHVLKIQRVMLYARFDQPLAADELTQIRGLVARRARHEPTAYLLGSKEFWSLPLAVTSATLIPRPDTETLVEVALGLIREDAAPIIADVGTGSGAIALALAKERPTATVYALEVSGEAREVAEANAKSLGLSNVRVLASDLLSGLPLSVQALDLVVANLPYIPTGDLPTLMADVQHFEPRLALDGGPDGLAVIRRLVPEAWERLRPGGALALEAGHGQDGPLRGLLEAAGFTSVSTQVDPGGVPRVTAGRRPR